MDAMLRKKGLLYRCLEVNTGEGKFTVEYNGRGIGHETVFVNGEVASRPPSENWFVPRFKFKIGSADTVLTVRVWPWLAIRSLKLIVEGETVYHEGAAEQAASEEELDYMRTGMPEGIQIVKSENEIRIIRKWFSGAAYALTFFAILFWGVSIFIAIDSGFVEILFINPLNYVGLWMVYRALTFFLNTTEIKVNQRELTVRHGPLPHLGRRQQTFLVSDIAEVKCVEKVRVVEDDSGSRSSIPYEYQLHIVTTTGERENILPHGHRRSDQVLFIIQEIEHCLGKNR